MTLYAVLVVIRQAVENFSLQRASTKILEVLSEFRKQWDSFVSTMGRMGDRLESAAQEYQKLVTTRSRKLDRQLERLDVLRDSEAIIKEASAPQGGVSAAVDSTADEPSTGPTAARAGE